MINQKEFEKIWKHFEEEKDLFTQIEIDKLLSNIKEKNNNNISFSENISKINKNQKGVTNENSKT